METPCPTTSYKPLLTGERGDMSATNVDATAITLPSLAATRDANSMIILHMYENMAIDLHNGDLCFDGNSIVQILGLVGPLRLFFLRGISCANICFLLLAQDNDSAGYV